MKKVFAIIAMMGVFTFGMTQSVSAQEEAVDTAATEQVDSAAVDSAVAVEELEAAEEEVAAPVVEEGSMYKNLKTKFIEGDAGFMSLVSVALVIGLAFCIERIIYLSLAEVNTKKLMAKLEEALAKGDVEGAKTICRNTRGPVASIFTQAFLRLADGQSLEEVEKAVVSYGGVEASKMEQNLSWISLFIAIAPSLGFLGTVIGMIQAFDAIMVAGDMSPAVVAGGMKVALITTVGGLIVAVILQIFFNYILSQVESLTIDMEDASISLMDILVKYQK